ncbi:LysR family transcriptional regulator [Pseudaminobacter arsenicus]|uniref:LysR family transcriptional regulator n=2 Tax=Borborobacter arsenicus TaxID=1851146 RepID=A0A432VBB8_9HYPH|nr:LysR family transcriptional regulator [Pseudaminobacter arsenicus]
MVMDVKLLETFRAVIETQSMTGAARLLEVTQPAISSQIARLESQVGFALFERVNGRLKASHQGRLFYAEVRNALGMIEQLAQEADNIRAGVAESVTIASHPSGSISILPGVIAELMRTRPLARIRMINRTSEEVRAIFEAGAADIAIAEWPIHIPDIHLQRYMVPCVAIVPEKHELAEKTVINPGDLSGVPLVGMPVARLIGHQIRNAFVEHHIDYLPVAESEYFSTICGMVAAGCGVAIVDRWSAETFRPLGLAVRPFQPHISYEIGVFRRANPAPTPLMDELAALLHQRLNLRDERIHGESS